MLLGLAAVPGFTPKVAREETVNETPIVFSRIGRVLATGNLLRLFNQLAAIREQAKPSPRALRDESDAWQFIMDAAGVSWPKPAVQTSEFGDSLVRVLANVLPGIKHEHPSGVARFARQVMWTLAWKDYGYPTFTFDADLAQALIATSCAGVNAGDLRLPYPAVLLAVPEGLLTGSLMDSEERMPVRLISVSEQWVYPVEYKIGQTDGYEYVRQWNVNLWIDDFQTTAGGPISIRPDHDVEDEIAGQTQAPLTHMVQPLSGEDQISVNAATRLAVNMALLLASYPASARGPVPVGSPLPRPTKKNPKPKLTRLAWNMESPIVLPPKPATGEGPSRGLWTLERRHLVRGHWRQQAFGPRWSQHRRQWIAPFWKGPASAVEAIRNYVVRDPREDGK